MSRKIWDTYGDTGPCRDCGTTESVRFYPMTTQRHNAPGRLLCPECAEKSRIIIRPGKQEAKP